jgi:basic membrane protein A
VVIDLTHALLLIGREVAAGGFTGRVITLGEKQDVVQLVLNPALANRVSPATRAAVDSVGVLIKAGTFAPLADLLQGNNDAKPVGPTVAPAGTKVP